MVNINDSSQKYTNAHKMLVAFALIRASLKMTIITGIYSGLEILLCVLPTPIAIIYITDKKLCIKYLYIIVQKLNPY